MFKRNKKIVEIQISLLKSFCLKFKLKNLYLKLSAPQAAGVDSEGEGVTNPNYRDSTKGEAVVNVNDHEELFRN